MTARAGRRPTPVSPETLVATLAGLFVSAAGSGRLRVAVDGADAAGGRELADALVDPLQRHGVEALRVSAADYLRAASLRYEHGRTDPDSFYESWLDTGALAREVLDPLGPQGSGRWLPALWDATADRATRAAYAQAGAPAVLLVDGTFLLGNGMSFDLAVHLHLSAAALTRRTPPDQHWTLPAYARYAAEVDPLSAADVIVRTDDPRHPAIQL